MISTDFRSPAHQKIWSIQEAIVITSFHRAGPAAHLFFLSFYSFSPSCLCAGSSRCANRFYRL